MFSVCRTFYCSNRLLHFPQETKFRRKRQRRERLRCQRRGERAALGAPPPWKAKGSPAVPRLKNEGGVFLLPTAGARRLSIDRRSTRMIESGYGRAWSSVVISRTRRNERIRGLLLYFLLVSWAPVCFARGEVGGGRGGGEGMVGWSSTTSVGGNGKRVAFWSLRAGRQDRQTDKTERQIDVRWYAVVMLLVVLLLLLWWQYYSGWRPSVFVSVCCRGRGSGPEGEGEDGGGARACFALWWMMLFLFLFF